jgi:6-phosphogluconolactonase/glucosamine-6-phosphate isomerase/deaminase
MKTKIIYFENFFCKNVFNFITKILTKNPTVLISGGNSIKRIVKNSKKKIYIDKVRTIILSDERIYNKIDDLRTNYSNLKKNFFSFFKFYKLNFIYFRLGQNNELLAKNFLKKIKTKIPKVAILSLGNDGHICSIFKETKNLNSNKYVNIIKPKNKIKRATINTKFLKKIKKIYLIVYGSKKGLALKKIILEKQTMFPLINYSKIIFILDKNAYEKIRYIKNIKYIKYFN